ncbi:hypothetical protein J2Z22_000793 [Paenibacillus forsythiae]|uniref:Uncharacterized protein n=1 Tax=Paenibacillus forsythiae TaxID=365616 RepID=A0ABU3H391_9BACL|nr:hypothetical protein [Paenibacillus forsythiae]
MKLFARGMVTVEPNDLPRRTGQCREKHLYFYAWHQQELTIVRSMT